MRKFFEEIGILLIAAAIVAAAAAVIDHRRPGIRAARGSRQEILPAKISRGPAQAPAVRSLPTPATAKPPDGSADMRRYCEKFSLPNELADKLIEAQTQGRVVPDSQAKPAPAEFEPISRINRLKAPSRAAEGFDLVQSQYRPAIPGLRSFGKPAGLLEAAIPLASEAAGVKQMKAEALALLGFEALAKDNAGLAQQAFGAMIKYYPADSETAVARLELARLLGDSGKKDQAWAVIDEAVSLNRDNPEYLTAAESLKKSLRENE